MTGSFDLWWSNKGKTKLLTLKDNEKITFDCENKEFVVLTKTCFEIMKIKEKILDKQLLSLDTTTKGENKKFIEVNSNE